MIFKSIIIRYGYYKKEIIFKKNVNLVFSKKNSVGKTTLLRLLLYSIGYAIPGTKGINFDKCDVESLIECEKGIIKILRINDSLEVFHEGGKNFYTLPYELYEFHKLIFNTANIDILSNLLGSIYVDQEKGWTLLNRGNPIGSNKFNIEELIRGLSDIDCSKYIKDLQMVNIELTKYKKMFNIAKYQTEINDLKENIIFDKHEEIIDKEILLLKFDKKVILDELKKIDDIIEENSSFMEYIEKMKLRVKSKSGEFIPVNYNTIVDFQDNSEILKTKKRMKLSQLSAKNKRIKRFSYQQDKENLMFETESIIQDFDQKISRIDINPLVVKNIIDKLESRKNKLSKKISNLTRKNNNVVIDIYNSIMKYVNELDLLKYINQNKEFIFTSDLKSLSGTILHEIVLIFKLSYIKVIENKLGITLPIILDSPSGREIKKVNIDNMIKILKRDFKENQIIIASIHEYDFDEWNLIEIVDYLFDIDKNINPF